MRDIIVFGAGTLGKDILPFLEETDHILFFVDNDARKWGSMFDKYLVKAPSEIEKYICDIVIASSLKGDTQIIGQLEQMGVSSDRIYLCCKVPSEDGFKNAIYSVHTPIPLVEYDLNHREEGRTGRLKVLLACTFYSTYTKQVIENLSKRYDDIEFSLLTKEAENKEKIAATNLEHIYCFSSAKELKMILEQMPVYDAIQLLWIELCWADLYKLIRTKAKRLNLNVGGSDFYRADREQRDRKKDLIACADRITAETEKTIQDFTEYYGELVKDKIGLLPFGIEVLDFIKRGEELVNAQKTEVKRQWHIPIDKIVVTCGHNGGMAHQHIKIIEALSYLDEATKKRIVCVFPMTYQKNDDYINEVCERADKSGIAYVILTEFMNFEQMAEYALISDVMIHVQTTDQLSSTMLEEMYAGSVVIAGSWLPYQSLHKMGIYFLDVDTISDITTALQEVVMKLDKYKEMCIGNRAIVWKHSSWNELAPRWRNLWDS